MIRRAGDPEPLVHDVSEEMGTPAILIGQPDWVITPPELGSKKLYIEHRCCEGMVACPACKAKDIMVKALFFKGSDLICLETSCCKQFLWVR